MKKLILLLVIFLIGCAPATTPTTIPVVTATKDVTRPDLDAFKIGPGCPNICWMGMQVGKTTRKEATEIFSKIPENVDMVETPGSLEGEWFTNKEKVSKAFVAIHFSNDIVDSIMLGRMAPFTTSDFIKLLGEPAKVWILWTDDHVGGGYRRTHYGLYYPDKKIEVQSGYSGIEESDWGGPEANAKIEWIKIGVPAQYEAHLQPWLGYGHMEDYRPLAVPTPAQ